MASWAAEAPPPGFGARDGAATAPPGFGARDGASAAIAPPGFDASAAIEPDATVPAPWRLQTHRPCAVCKEHREKACYSGNQWKRPSVAVCKACLAAQQAVRTGPDGKTLPEFMPGGASYCPGVKTARNQRRQKAARSLPLRKNGQPPRFDAEDVRELAASKGCEEHKERRQQQMKEEADARTAALGTFADLGL